MKILRDTDILRMITAAAGRIEVNASFGDYTSPTTLDLDRPANSIITTATTTTIVGSPASGAKRNVKDVSITNNHATLSNLISVEHHDGTNAAELISFVLLPGENCYMNETGGWTHNDASGAPYPAVGAGQFDGFTTPFLKVGTAGDGIGWWYCTSKDSGTVGAWAPGTPGVNGRVTDGTLSADGGCIPIKNPGTGRNFLTEVSIGGTTPHTHMLFDVLWVNSGLSATTLTEQAIATPALPARDINGSINGEGCVIGLLAVSALGNSTTKFDTTIRYTNSDGVANRVATLVNQGGGSSPATPVIGTIVWFMLQAGDKGVKSIEGFSNVTTMTSGTFSLLIARWFPFVPNLVANIAGTWKATGAGARLYNGTCMLHAYVIANVAATTIQGSLTVEEK